jgi:hypothetical protein
MIRRLFTFAAILSLLVCVAAGALWVRSERRTDVFVAGYWHYQTHPHYTNYFDAWELNAFNDHGRVRVRAYLHGCVAGPGRYEAFPRQRGRVLAIDPAGHYGPYTLGDDLLGKARPMVNLPGFRYWSAPRVVAADVSHGALLALTAVLPLIELFRLRRRRRSLAAGMCAVCGYDLRASRERCPECGTMIRAGSLAPHAGAQRRLVM